MAVTTRTSTTSAPAPTTHPPTSVLQSEGVAALLRWGTLLILTALAVGIDQRALWPVALDSDLAVLLVYGYAGFCLVITVLLLVPGLRKLHSAGYVVDIGVLSLFVVSGQPGGLLFPLYLLPVVGFGVRAGIGAGSALGIVAALGLGGATIGRPLLAPETELATTDYIGVGLQGLVLAILPWLITTFTEQWSRNNRASVLQAEQQAEAARQETQQTRNQMKTLYTVAATLAEAIRGEKVLNALFDQGNKLVPYKAGLGLLPTGKPGQLRVDTGYGVSIIDPGEVIKVTQGGTFGAALYPPADPQTIENIDQEADLQRLTTVRGCKSACLIPLRSGVNVYGLALFLRHTTAPFTAPEVEILQALTSYATVALLNQDLTREVNKDRMDMATAEEHARHWLAREIHDGLAQKLAAITMNLDFIKRMMAHNPDEAAQELDKLGDMYKRANYDVRTLLGELKPTTLETKGLPSALEEYVNRLRTYNEHIDFQVEARGVSGMTLSKEARGTLFNIVQESLNNALKYAQAKHIWLRMVREGYRLTITIQDDGKGFNVEESREKAKARGSYGLSNLSERAKMVGGVTEVISAPGKGTTIKVNVPLEV